MDKKLLWSPEHPVWPTIRLVVGMICVTVVLACNASSLDQTEYKSIAWICGLALGGEAIKRFLSGAPSDT